MRTVRPWRAENWADFLPNTLGLSQEPVDLYAVARHRRVKRLGFRFMIPRGVLLPVGGGFEVYLRDSSRKDLDITGAEPAGLLSPHQRFSLAHEIAHTFFFRHSDSVPTPNPEVSNEFELEKICDRTAGYILVPTDLLKQKIQDCQKIDTAFVRSTALAFRTSLEVLINRLSVVESGNPFERCILLARRLNRDAEVRAVYFGVGLRRTLPKPSQYTRVTDWLPDFPRQAIDERRNSTWSLPRVGRDVSFIKTEVGKRGDFLLEVTATSER